MGASGSKQGPPPEPANIATRQFSANARKKQSMTESSKQSLAKLKRNCATKQQQLERRILLLQRDVNQLTKLANASQRVRYNS